MCGNGARWVCVRRRVRGGLRSKRQCSALSDVCARRINTRTHAHAHAQAQAQAQAHTRTHGRTDAHTHTHTHTRGVAATLSRTHTHTQLQGSAYLEVATANIRDDDGGSHVIIRKVFVPMRTLALPRRPKQQPEEHPAAQQSRHQITRGDWAIRQVF